MRPDGGLILIILAVVGLGGPALLGLLGLILPRREAVVARGFGRVDWALLLASTLLYCLAFNLVFFVQELFLVLPKAFTPGLEPVLFHNNHDWSGDNPLAELLQGTGALAILLTGLIAAAVLALRPPRRLTLRLFLIWVAYQGLFQSLPQGVIGAVLPMNDVGRAMDYLDFGRAALMATALASLAAMALAGVWLTRPVLSLAAPGQAANRRTRLAFVTTAAFVPGLLGTLLVLPFRVPGSLDQVVLVPVAVAVLGLGWMAAGAWTHGDAPTGETSGRPSIVAPALALLLVLALFQLVLRPGVHF